MAAPTVSAQSTPLGDGPWEFDTVNPTTRIRVSVVTKALTRPWGLAFLPNGDMLVTERAGALRIIRDDVLDPDPISGLPEVAARCLGGLMDIALHPNYETNGLVYFVYSKPGEIPAGAEYFATTALGRGRFDGTALRDVEDVFVADAWSTNPCGQGARMTFAPDGMLFMTQPHRQLFEVAQDLSNHLGTIVRLNDDGSVPADNPFVGRSGHLPEIYSYGHRVSEGLAIHPETGQVWATEHGPQGGDEANIIIAGANYGWPITTFGRDYDGTKISEKPWLEGTVQPELVWIPSIATSGMVFLTSDRFPEWHGNLFVGAMMVGAMPESGHIERIPFSEHGELGREWLLADLHQRIRDVRQGPDGLLYALTAEVAGALLRIEPMN